MKRIIPSWNKSLMGRLVGTTLLLLLATVGLISYLAYLQATRSLTQSIFDRLRAVSILKEDSLNRWVDQQRVDLVFLASQSDVTGQAGVLMGESSSVKDRILAHSILIDRFKSMVAGFSESDELFILDLYGTVVLSTEPGREGMSHRYDPHFILGQSATYVQPVYISTRTGRSTITIATPLFDQDKRRVGVLAGDLNLARLDRIILQRTGLGSSGETYLVNPQHEFVSSMLASNSKNRNGGVRSYGIDLALKGQDGAALYTNYQGVPVIGYYNWLDDRQVALMAEMSQAEAFAPARQMAMTIIEIGGLSTLFLAVLAYLLSRRIARPILTMAEKARLIAGGDLDQIVPVMTGDEVGLLAQSFNNMTGQLRLLYADLEQKVIERTAELVRVNSQLEEEIGMRKQAQEGLHRQNTYLEALHETSLGLISHLDLQDLFETLVTRAGQLMHSSHGFIFVAEGEVLECKVGIGLLNRLVGRYLTRGEGLGGTIWETGRPLVINNYDQWQGRAQTIEHGLIRSVAGFPLTAGDQVVGVIGLAYGLQDQGREFGDAEVELLGRFAQLASIALENARLYTLAKEARDAAEKANEAQSIFLANVSHELRTPLTSILGFARLAQKRLQERIAPYLPANDARQQKAALQMDENLAIILTEGDRLTKLINNLLDLEKIRSGKISWRRAPLNITEVITLAARATSSLLESKGLTWIQEIPPHLPQVYGDADRLEQVVINLISNAVKYSENSPLECRVMRLDGELIVSLTDHGIGIAPEFHELIFEKFRQVGDTLSNKPRGTGLGLPICKEIVEYHGGKIWLKSEPGKGSTFFFSLPVYSPALEKTLAARDEIPAKPESN
ncbi:MAG TPA: ATP-binding protein [Anaerolineaceae bacterium]|nr:ATP-binding protein [Anaerolineaceae bacterium]